MAVVNTNSSLIHDYLDPASTQPEPKLARGRGIFATGDVANASDDSSGSRFQLVTLPSDVILLSGTFFDVENWGFAQVAIGTKDDPTALVNQTKATENVVSPIGQGDANHGKFLWEVLGLAEDPGANISLYAHAVADATGAGSMLFQIAYLDD